jgi:hypothetical protein
MRVFGIVVLSTVVAWSLYLAVTGTHGYLVGAKSWHVLPTAAALMAITIANGWAFLQVTRGRRGGAWSGC